MRTLMTVVLTAVMIQGLATPPYSQVPSSMNVQGRLTDSTGTPLPAGMKTFTFKIFDMEAGGTEVWPSGVGENQSIMTDDAGLWNAHVGAVLPIPDSVFADTSRWLVITVDDEVNKPTTLPRVKLNSGPFVFRAAWSQNAVIADSADAITDGGVDFADIGQNGATNGQVMKWIGSAWVAAEDNTSGGSGGGWTDDGTVVRLDTSTDSVGIGTSAPSEKLEVVGNVLVSGKATIGFGHTNTGSGGFVAGADNVVTGKNATVTGGDGNSADGAASTVGGGQRNSATNSGSTVAGGKNNTSSGADASIAGGNSNAASGDSSFVGGGSRNAASGVNAAVSGGYADTASSDYTTVGGGRHNVASNYAGTVGGGFGNQARANYSTVGGGNSNDAGAASSTISGGNDNTAGGVFSAISGGNTNMASGSYSAISGGTHNTASGHYSLIGGGSNNTAGGDSSFVGGGSRNAATSVNSTVSGGRDNRADSVYSTVGGGWSNRAGGVESTVGGGDRNLASGIQSTVGGGVIDTASGTRSTISGGIDNNAAGYASTVAGGESNSSSGEKSFVGGGRLNTASGSHAMVPGGYLSTASGDYSFAAGRKANAIHSGSFVWGDSTNAHVISTKPNQFLIRATNGVDLVSNADTSVSIEVGERFRDNGLVAWGRVAFWGNLEADFGVTSVVRTAVGRYEVTIDAAASSEFTLIPIAQAVSSTGIIRIVSVLPTSVQTFSVLIHDEVFSWVDSDFVFMVTAR